MKTWLPVLALALLACGGDPPPPPQAPPPAPVPTPTPPNTPARPVEDDWVKTSNENTKLLLAVTAAFGPEGAARLGIDGLDEKILEYTPDREARFREALTEASKKLRARKTQEKHALVLQDLDLLLAAADREIRESKVEEDTMVPYLNVTELVFESATGLLDDQVAPARRPAFVARLRKYAGMDGGTPLVELARAKTMEAMKKPGLTMPAKIELEKHLSNNATMREGIQKLLVKYEIKGFEEPLALLTKQLVAYDDFIKKTMLPKARASFVLPPAMYAIALERYGVDMAPADLAANAHKGFEQIQAEMKTVAAEVAKEKKLSNADYREVLKALKKEQVGGDAILDHYKKRLAEVEAILVKEKLVTLPSRPARIRVGTPAENAQMPAPHMQPPRLLGNTGEQGEFVLPLEVPGQKNGKLDDFTYAAASWTLTAHEARPGHEMQFAAMVEKGVSDARAIYAFNSANVEGWGLYSEAMLYPYMPAEGKLVSLQLRLQRAVRAFMDPELQQGKWTFDSAKAFLVKEVGLSPAFATSEVERYTFRSPGQATSYWFGYLKLMELRRELEGKPGFDPRKFHDFLLGQGLLPPRLIREAALAAFR